MTPLLLLRRRTVLAAAGLAAGAAALAACSSRSGASSATAAGNRSSGESSGGRPLARLSDIPVGEAVAARDDADEPIVIAQPQPGTAVAFSAVCTHQGCTVKPAGRHITCRCHGARYEATTGEVVRGPAKRPLRPVPVHVVDGDVLAGAPA